MIPAHKHLQREAYRRMWREADRKRRRERFAAGRFGWIVHWPRILTSWPFVIAVIAVFSLMLVARALAQVQVPPDCFQLAKREGFPTDAMTKTQAAKAKLRLARLSDDDPIVRSCRYAVTQLKAAKK